MITLNTFNFTSHCASMDAYGALSVDDLFDLPNDDFFSSSSSAAALDFFHHHSSAAGAATYFDQPSYSTDFNYILSVPNEDKAELEWMSTYMDDSYTDFLANVLTSTSANNAAVFHGRARSKCSRPSTSATVGNQIVNVKEEERFFGGEAEVGRRCTHCTSEKTPQWRTGPLGPKTLCNECGVRFKSGRLVPEYRPAASPTFVLTQHSNSHRKVMELRRQKEMLRQDGCGRHFRV